MRDIFDHFGVHFKTNFGSHCLGSHFTTGLWLSVQKYTVQQYNSTVQYRAERVVQEYRYRYRYRGRQFGTSSQSKLKNIWERLPWYFLRRVSFSFWSFELDGWMKNDILKNMPLMTLIILLYIVKSLHFRAWRCNKFKNSLSPPAD